MWCSEASSHAYVHAGSLGGTVEAIFLQPIDVIKTRLQLDKVGKYKGKPPASSASDSSLS